MATKPTGRPRGRPRKEKSQMAPKSRGRPKKALAESDDRYFLAIVQANIDKAKENGISERKVVEVYSALRNGMIVDAPGNIAAMIEWNKFEVSFKGRRRGCLPDHQNHQEQWHQKNAFRPGADGLRLRLRKIRTAEPTDASRRWLRVMSSAWRICFEGDMRLANHAEALAAIAGERAYFQRVMKPLLIKIFAGKIFSQASETKAFISVPEFMAILIPTT
jgi:hypothetical protein